jgi:hypothetical protein
MIENHLNFLLKQKTLNERFGKRRMNFLYWKSSRLDPKTVLIFLPGNPGIPSFYQIFLQYIHDHFEEGIDIWCPSYVELHLSLNDLADQIVDFYTDIRNMYPQGTKFVIASHSLGSYLTVQLLKRLPDESSIVKIICLFPSLQWLGDTPGGQQVQLIAWSIPRLLISLFAALLSVLPQILISFIMSVFLGLPDHIIESSSSFLFKREHALSSLYLGYCQMQDIKELDVETIHNYKEKFIIYFGIGDHLCPEDHIEDISKAVDIEYYRCVDNVDHAFVVEGSIIMGRKLIEWITKAIYQM